MFERFYRGRADGAPRAEPRHRTRAVDRQVARRPPRRARSRSSREPGRGTDVPRAAPGRGPGRETSPSLDAIRGRRVLIVDDEREIAELIAGQLAPLEVEATIATSGDAGAAELRASRYDAVTLDILMPGHGRVRGAARRSAPTRSCAPTPIVFVSVFSGRQELAGEWVVSQADRRRRAARRARRRGRAPAAPACWSSAARSCRRCSSRRSTSSGSSTSGRRPARPRRGLRRAPLRGRARRRRDPQPAGRRCRRSTCAGGACGGR